MVALEEELADVASWLGRGCVDGVSSPWEDITVAVGEGIGASKSSILATGGIRIISFSFSFSLFA